MRLIDADTLLNQIKYKPIPNIVSETWNELYERVIEEIDNAPTVYPICEDQACKYRANERPHGKWLRPYKIDIAYECSNCRMQMPITDYFNFCPNCGADMRGEDYD